jgi:hypothetical protein
MFPASRRPLPVRGERSTESQTPGLVPNSIH